ncbi:SRPBCC family protein [Actinoallomurus spadix]|uniref:SRPBCC family protein n=1 Tax=Actinoallomurus spadix TaxID=79912 RepID=A0ABN0WID7_9ACTN|nr:SRPBCC family protein [Actinoallomurus spadix]MCO5989898.1 SRPBCC family protein [Actinoallomurus spadix]
MSSVMESIDVHVPVHTAYNQWTQFEDFPEFMEGVEEIRQVNDTLTHWKVKVAGATREYDAKITEQRPDERIAWTSVEEPKNAGVVTFHRLDDDHTRVALQLEVEPEGFLENVADKTGMVKHRAKNDLKRFKEFIEERGGETGSWRGEVGRPDER